MRQFRIADVGLCILYTSKYRPTLLAGVVCALMVLAQGSAIVVIVARRRAILLARELSLKGGHDG